MVLGAIGCEYRVVECGVWISSGYSDGCGGYRGTIVGGLEFRGYWL